MDSEISSCFRAHYQQLIQGEGARALHPQSLCLYQVQSTLAEIFPSRCSVNILLIIKKVIKLLLPILSPSLKRVGKH